MEYVNELLKKLYKKADEFQFKGRKMITGSLRNELFNSESGNWAHTLLTYSRDIKTKNSFLELFMFMPGVNPKTFQKLPIYLRNDGRAEGIIGPSLEQWLCLLQSQDVRAYRRLMSCEFTRLELELGEFEMLCGLGEEMLKLYDSACSLTALFTDGLKARGWNTMVVKTLTLLSTVSDPFGGQIITQYVFHPDIDGWGRWSDAIIDVNNQDGFDKSVELRDWLAQIPEDQYYWYEDL